MGYKVRFRIKNRLGKASIYTLRDICVCLVERYSLTNTELENILFLSIDSVPFSNEDLEIRRVN